MKKIFKYIGWSALSIGLIVLLGFSEQQNERRGISAIDIFVDQSNGNYFVTNNDVKEIITNQGYKLGLPVSQLDLVALEKAMNNMPAVDRADVYVTISGVLHVDVKQREPVLRVYNSSGESFYLDKKGKAMPLSAQFAARVPVVSGDISVGYAAVRNKQFGISSAVRDTLAELRGIHCAYDVAMYAGQDSLWLAQVGQYVVTPDGELEIIPRVGDHVIVFGDSTDKAEKFSKLLMLYKKGLSKTGWGKYSQINLKYKNQVVCKIR